MFRVGVVGATGYAGRELVRWLLGHPHVELAGVASTTRAGMPLASVVEGLLGVTDLVLEAPGPWLTDLDAVFVAVPHGKARPIIDELGSAPLVVDLSRDHRHAPGWVYGLAEHARHTLPGATRVAVPGCFATAISMAVAPLVGAGVVEGPVSICAATGSTGSGAKPLATTHHPERFADLRPYKVLQHQHVPEIRTLLAGLGDVPALHMVPVSAPLDRGMLATCFVPVGDADATAIVRDAYAGAALVRMRQGVKVRHVRGTAFCDLGVYQDHGMAVVISAIDNLGKGAASQAVQCLNLALGLPPTAGLIQAAPLP